MSSVEVQATRQMVWTTPQGVRLTLTQEGTRSVEARLEGLNHGATFSLQAVQNLRDALDRLLGTGENWQKEVETHRAWLFEYRPEGPARWNPRQARQED